MSKTILPHKLTLTFILTFLLSLTIGQACFAAKSNGLPEQYLSEFSQNDILFYDPCAGDGSNGSKLNIGTKGCFKVNDGVDAKGFWYGEGCLNTGDCKSDNVKYYAQGSDPKSDHGLVMTKNNDWIYEDTKVDNDFGGMQYIYAENYDFKYDGSSTKLTPNGKSSTKKYYWIVLPDQAYTNGFGDTYVATFEKLEDPVYFIVFDAHACGDQSEKYCDKAKSDPEKVSIGKEFFGSFTKDGSQDGGVAKKAGKLTSFCRLKGSGEVTAKGKSGTINSEASDDSTSSSNSSNSSTTSSGKGATSINDKALELAWPYSQTDKAKVGPTKAYEKAIEQYTKADMDTAGGTWNEETRRLGQSCDLYVATVMRASGADENYPIGLPGQYPYVKDSDDYQEVPSYKDAQAGDIAFFSSNDGPFDESTAGIGSGNGHTWLIVEDGGKKRSAQASYGEEAGVVKDIQFTDKDVKVFRSKKAGGTNCVTYSGDYPQYYQDDYEKSDHKKSNHNWTGDSYSKGDVAEFGSGPVSAAMLVTVATGKDVYPQDIIEVTSSDDPTHHNYAGGKGCSKDCGLKLDEKLADEYGIEVKIESFSSKSDAYKKIKKYLDDGYMIHLSIQGTHDGLAKDAKNHYIGIFDINKDNEVQIANPNENGNIRIDLKDIKEAIHGGKFAAIKGSSTTKNTCKEAENLCSGEGANGGTASKKGLTVEQAEIIAHWYNSKHTPKGCCGLRNCVEFSNFFVAELTTKGTPGGYVVSGNGDQVAPNLISSKVTTGGNIPKAWSVFSDTGQHTGVVIGANSDGTFITIEAAWPGWQDGYTDGDGNARVYPAKTFDSTYTFAYFEDYIKEDRINEMLND